MSPSAAQKHLCFKVSMKPTDGDLQQSGDGGENSAKLIMIGCHGNNLSVCSTAESVRWFSAGFSANTQLVGWKPTFQLKKEKKRGVWKQEN